uniref:Thioredoxin domain-containing protein n=1 Tax=Chlamydomonas euryale TaxID=1486919 RepID=A0A7R9YYD1_9CHLO|mmetsp:Transcript_35526/g.105020  ORF Transcript_35526/g.105020 Transcript_35526/m.105020 type:complete len:122 (+) Transcript_35526:141-506(+)
MPPLPAPPGGHLRTAIHALSERRPRMLFFYSRACSLCKQLAPRLEAAVVDSAAPPVAAVPICCDNQLAWAPEMLHYDVQQVPCFVLLNEDGVAVGKSGEPRDLLQMTEAMEFLLALAPPVK